MLFVPLLLKICFDLSVILGQVVSESEADLWSKFLIIILIQERLEILTGETNVHILHCCSEKVDTCKQKYSNSGQLIYMRDYSQGKKQCNGANLSTRFARFFLTVSKNRTITNDHIFKRP